MGCKRELEEDLHDFSRCPPKAGREIYDTRDMAALKISTLFHRGNNNLILQ